MEVDSTLVIKLRAVIKDRPYRLFARKAGVIGLTNHQPQWI